MSPNPVSFLQHLRDKGYHSRSDKHSNALAEAIIQDLFKYCHAIHEKATRGQIVYWLNFDLISGSSTWNSDLVIGSPELGAAQPPRLWPGFPCSRPSEIRVAIELKAIMTEHRKAVKNRKRDLEAHHEHVHHFNDRAIAAGVFVINASESFQSPLRQGITVHRKPLDLVRHCISELRSVALRGGPTGYGLEAKCALVVEMDNVDFAQARYFGKDPAPQLGDPLHYDAFIRRICELYEERFC